MTIKTILVRSISSKYRRTDDGVCILDPDATLEVHEGEQSVGRQPSYYRTAEIKTADVQEALPAHIVAQASVDNPVVQLPLAAVSAEPSIATLGTFTAAHLHPSRVNIKTKIKPSVLDNTGAASVLIGLADPDTGDYIGAGILGTTRGAQATPVYGASVEIAGASIDIISYIAHATIPRVADTARMVRAEIKAGGTSSFSFLGSIVDETTGLDTNTGSAGSINAVTEEKVAAMQAFLKHAVPAIIVLDGDGESGDVVELLTLDIS